MQACKEYGQTRTLAKHKHKKQDSSESKCINVPFLQENQHLLIINVIELPEVM